MSERFYVKWPAYYNHVTNYSSIHKNAHDDARHVNGHGRAV
ncbi:hypothetical protein [Mucilaginibacter phyllosphaerae]